MYLQTAIGNFSIVADKNRKGVFLVRSRVKKDIDNFCHLSDLKERVIYQNQYSDYKYRIFVNHDVLIRFFFTYIANLNYTNFKAEIERLCSKNKKERWRIGLVYDIYTSIATHSRDYNEEKKIQTS